MNNEQASPSIFLSYSHEDSKLVDKIDSDFANFGIRLKRDAWMQAEQGLSIHLLDEGQPGDLAFFDNEEGKIIHTGILISKNRIIHASGKVRIDNIDHHGIFNQETKKYTHNLRLIRRIL